MPTAPKNTVKWLTPPAVLSYTLENQEAVNHISIGTDMSFIQKNIMNVISRLHSLVILISISVECFRIERLVHD